MTKWMLCSDTLIPGFEHSYTGVRLPCQPDEPWFYIPRLMSQKSQTQLGKTFEDKSVLDHFHWDQCCCCTGNGGNTWVCSLSAGTAAAEHMMLDLGVVHHHTVPSTTSHQKCHAQNAWAGVFNSTGSIQETCRKVSVFMVMYQSDTRAGVSTDTWIRSECLHLGWDWKLDGWWHPIQW